MNPYLFDLRKIGDPLHFEIWPLTHTTSTPTFLLCFLPFARLPVQSAYWLWVLINLTALAIAVGLILTMWGHGLPKSVIWLVADAVVLYAPLGDHIAFAQVQTIILLMLVLTMRSLQKEREVAAGLALSFAIMLRAFPLAMMFYLMITRRWRAMFSAIFGCAVIGIITIEGVGWDLVRSFVDGAALTLSHHPVSLPINIGVGPFITRLFWHLCGSTLSPAADLARKAAILFADLAVIGFSVWATLRTSEGRDLSMRAYGLWVIVSVMLSPLAWIHYMILFLLPFIQVTFAAYRKTCNPPAMWLVLASYFLIPISIGLRDPVQRLGIDVLYTVVAEGAFVSVLLAYYAAYRFVLDEPLMKPPAVAIGTQP